jgi:hypothetical protein
MKYLLLIGMHLMTVFFNTDSLTKTEAEVFEMLLKLWMLLLFSELRMVISRRNALSCTCNRITSKLDVWQINFIFTLFC